MYDVSRFPPRWLCGNWPEWLGWLHIVSDFLVCGAYMVAAVTITAWRIKTSATFGYTWMLIVAFFVLCALSHGWFAVQFWYPDYFFDGVAVKPLQAVVAWCAGISMLSEHKRWIAADTVHKTIDVLKAAADVATPFYVVDTKGICLFANQKFYDFLGYSPAEILGRNMHAKIHHTRFDGSPYPEEECVMFRAMKENIRTCEYGDTVWDVYGHPVRVDWVSTPLKAGGSKIDGARIELNSHSIDKSLLDQIKEIRGQVR